jgi:ribosome-binding factor A
MWIDMTTRRQEKVARIVRQVVSDAIANHLSDPRITGFVTVTRVEMAADLRAADVYLSIFETETTRLDRDKADDEYGKTFDAIKHAKSRIQAMLANRLQSKFCPVLRFRTDKQLKNTLDTINLIDRAVGEIETKDANNHDRQ